MLKMAKEEIKEKMEKRLEELQGELKMHTGRMNQMNQLAQIEAEQIIAKKGAINELQNILRVEVKKKEEEVKKPIKKPIKK